MDTSSKPLWAILGIPILLLVAGLILRDDTDRARFERLEVGMTAEQVQAIIAPPRGGKYGHMRRMQVGDNDILHLNQNMILTMREGRLVDKKWVGKEVK